MAEQTAVAIALLGEAAAQSSDRHAHGRCERRLVERCMPKEIQYLLCRADPGERLGGDLAIGFEQQGGPKVEAVCNQPEVGDTGGIDEFHIASAPDHRAAEQCVERAIACRVVLRRD